MSISLNLSSFQKLKLKTFLTTFTLRLVHAWWLSYRECITSHCLLYSLVWRLRFLTTWLVFLCHFKWIQTHSVLSYSIDGYHHPKWCTRTFKDLYVNFLYVLKLLHLIKVSRNAISLLLSSSIVYFICFSHIIMC